MRYLLLVAFLLRCAPADNSETQGFYGSNALWPDHRLSVCWENPSAETELEQQWVQDRIRDSWQQAANISITGWGNCNAAPRSNLRILISDQGPHTKDLGRFLDQRPHGMVLNFALTNWSVPCAQERRECIETIALHEFGHALGLMHEQNRDDRPQDCLGSEERNLPTVKVGEFDRDSIMNYCYHSNFSNRLSLGDIETIHQMYGNEF